MNKKICALLIALSPVSLLLSGCSHSTGAPSSEPSVQPTESPTPTSTDNPTVNQKGLVVESQVWIGWDVGDYEPAETTTYEDLYEGLVVYDNGEVLKITVKSASGDKVTLAFDGFMGVVEKGRKGTDWDKPLKEIDIERGQTVKLESLTEDVYTYFTISYSK